MDTNKINNLGWKASIKLKEGILADIAPTILERLGLHLPNEMSGNSLIKY